MDLGRDLRGVPPTTIIWSFLDIFARFRPIWELDFFGRKFFRQIINILRKFGQNLQTLLHKEAENFEGGLKIWGGGPQLLKGVPLSP